MEANILGTIYTIFQQTVKENKQLEDCGGYVDFTSKKIYIRLYDEEEIENIENMDVLIKSTVSHEIIHAYLYESGLNVESDWARNEEMIDWIALQFPKMAKTLKDIGTL